MLELGRILEQVRYEPLVAAVAGRLRNKGDAGLVKSDVQIGAQQYRLGAPNEPFRPTSHHNIKLRFQK